MKIRSLLMMASLLGACAQPTDVVDAPPDDAVGPTFGKVGSGGPDAVRINGFGHQGSGNTIRTFSFSAAISEDGDVEGFFELHARAADVRLRGTLTCATVYGRWSTRR